MTISFSNGTQPTRQHVVCEKRRKSGIAKVISPYKRRVLAIRQGSTSHNPSAHMFVRVLSFLSAARFELEA